MIACNCKICKSDLNYNKRKRSAILIKKNNKRILVDFGPDIRNQLLENNIENLDAVICTHAHYDHIAGIDDLKVFSYKNKSPLTIYTDYITKGIIDTSYRHLIKSNGDRMPVIETKSIDLGQNTNICGIDITFFEQIHGKISSIGIKLGNFVYSNDVSDFPHHSLNYLKKIKYWVLDCIDYKRSTAHAGLEEVLYWREKFKPERIFLTNLSHNIDYYEIMKYLPKDTKPSYDGMKIYI